MINSKFLNSFISNIKDSVIESYPTVKKSVERKIMLQYHRFNIIGSLSFISYCNHMYDVCSEIYDFSCDFYYSVLKRCKQAIAIRRVDIDKCVKIMELPDWHVYLYVVGYYLTIETVKFICVSIKLVQFLSLIFVPYCCHVFISIPKSDPHYNSYFLKQRIFDHLTCCFEIFNDTLKDYYFIQSLIPFLIENVDRGKFVNSMSKLELLSYINYTCDLIKMADKRIKSINKTIHSEYKIMGFESMKRKLSSLSLKSIYTVDRLSRKIYINTIILKEVRLLIFLYELNKKIIYDAVNECKSKNIDYIKIDKEIIELERIEIDNL